MVQSNVITVFYLLSGLSLVTMLGSLVLALRLRRLASGGHVGRPVGILLGFIVLFLLGYMAAPLLPFLGPDVALLFTAAVFLFGAIFVVLVLRLIQALVQQILDELKL